MNLWTILERTARSHPKQIAAVDGESRVTYAELRARCAALAVGLAQRGVQRGDRIAIVEPNSLAYFESYFATAALGAILVPLNTRLLPAEWAKILRHSGSRFLIAHGSFAAAVQELATDGALDLLVWTSESGAWHTSRHPSAKQPATPAVFAEGWWDVCQAPYSELLTTPTHNFRPEELPDDHVAQLYYTSGTTGEPKGVMLTHANVFWHALGARAEFAISDSDVWSHVAPMFHLADAWSVFAFTWCGATHVFAPRFDERAVLDLFVRERVTMTNLVPTMLQRLVSFEGAAQRHSPSLRMILSGGAPIAPSVVRRIIETFRCEYVQTYGMTETSPFLTVSLLKAHLRDAPPDVQFGFRAKTGRAFATVDLEVIGEDGLPVPADGAHVGEIRARGPTVTPGYWRDAAATARAFHDGWLCTGDLATIDAEGYLQIVDRKKDMIITGGEKVYSTEVEHVLHAHPGVLECAVFGVADAEWGERVEACVVLRPGSSATESELAAHARRELASFKVPRRIRFWNELPKTGSGKIEKRRLRDSCGAGD
ncbi:MAG TPA: long-chain-fatty-acid--CoA ligase [Planctomycetota bacterium]|nr:long-chain-fatty-acid--CoA ligase [Planctomycetota bacterium]